METKTVIDLVAEMLRNAGETSAEADAGAGGIAYLFVALDDRLSVCLSNVGDTWGADIADLEEAEMVGFIETRLAVDTTDAETLAGALKVHLDLARLDLKPYRIYGTKNRRNNGNRR